MRCPVCNREFDDELELKTKPKIYLCFEHGLFQEVDGRLEPVRYPCPKCRGNYKLPKRIEGSWAVCECEKHGEWRVSFLRSFKFRKLCSIVASKPTKSPSFYTTAEHKVKRILDSLGIRYDHNKCFVDGKHRYYCDFVIYNGSDDPIAVVEASPSIWHERWNREESEARKRAFIESLGMRYVELTERNSDRWDQIISDLVKGGMNSE